MKKEYKSYEKSRLEGQPVYAIRIGDAVMEVQKEAYMEFCRARSREKYLLRMAAIYREIPYSNLDTDGMSERVMANSYGSQQSDCMLQG